MLLYHSRNTHKFELWSLMKQSPRAFLKINLAVCYEIFTTYSVIESECFFYLSWVYNSLSDLRRRIYFKHFYSWENRLNRIGIKIFKYVFRIFQILILIYTRVFHVKLRIHIYHVHHVYCTFLNAKFNISFRYVNFYI